ncbi:MAG TPA: hypothetical protein VMW41_05740 [Candidatus Bathyarchaeia archaeon]|nr:hypothetical protein [Candidatus Bathyarchaeia archaeon]
MKQTKISLISASISGYFLLTAIFLQALVFPLKNVDFIYEGAIITYFIEFINIHSTVSLLMARSRQTVSKLTVQSLLLVYLFFAFILMLNAKNKLLIIYFTISLINKILFNQSLPNKNTSFIVTFLLLGSVGLAILTGPVWKFLFPFPPEVLLMRPKNISGLFVDVPQILLAWGVIYTLAMGIYEIRFLKN